MVIYYGTETAQTRRCEHGKLGDEWCAPCAGFCEECNGERQIPTYFGDPNSPAERCFQCDGTGKAK